MKNIKVQNYLQGNNENLIGSILHIKNHKKQYFLNEWRGIFFYIDHLTGRIERYSIYYTHHQISTYKTTKSNFITFLMYLAKEYLNINPKLVYSYDDPDISWLVRLDHNKEVVNREFFIDYKNIDNPQIAMPLGITIPVINLAMQNSGINIIQIDKKYESQLISNFRSEISIKLIKNDDDIGYLVKRFNYSTRLRIERLLNK